MNINDAFPSNYVKASDLKGKEVVLKISRVAMEDIGGDHKPIVYFHGAEKGMVLNKTNSMNIATLYGPETDGWVGKEVLLYPTWVDFQGRSVEAVRVRGPQGSTMQHAGQTPLQGGNGAPNIDDDIPFAPIRDLP